MKSPLVLMQASIANWRLARLMRNAARQTRANQLPVSLDASTATSVDRWLAAGATCHLDPGAIDQLVMVPELACKLIDAGARPTQNLLEELLAWTRRSPLVLPIIYGETFPGRRSSKPPNAYQWLHGLVDMALRVAPGLDWNRQVGPQVDRGLEALLSRQLEDAFPGLFYKVELARRSIGMTQWPNEADSRFYTEIMFIAMDTQNLTYGRPSWMHEFIDEVVLQMLDLGANPNACRRANDYKRVPALAWALLATTDCVKDFLARGAVVDDNTIAHATRMIFDQEMIAVHRSKKEKPFEQILIAHEGQINWSMKIKTSDALDPSLQYCIDKRFPGMRARVDAARSSREMERTVDVPAIGPSARPSRF